MLRSFALVLTTAASLALPALASPASAASDTDLGRAAAARALVYRATARFHQHSEAVRAGYVPDKYCVANRQGQGAIGYPHFNHAYDNSVDPAKPAALYYEDDGHGGKRLAGVQWVVFDRDGNPATDDDRPTMFGTSFKGPQRGNFPGQPVHYALHLWLWKHNPLGAYETFNSAVRCLPGTTRPAPPA
ncbi:hypothetical protein [Streptomyces sp. NPDC091371]|uniref:hypothetical protein n=1 Tax=Streptomyces sp. NPDC091371 TaxID=3155303 RepID=UPI0034275073